MQSPKSYVLVLNQESEEDSQRMALLLKRLKCPVVVATSADQAMSIAMQSPPYLVILVGNHRGWSRPLVDNLRKATGIHCSTILALNESHAPSWLHQEDNPGFDGFLVKPVNADVLSSLVQSAWVRQTYCSAVG